MVPAVVWDWGMKEAATVDRGSRRITTPDQTGVQKLHHEIATRAPEEYHDILQRQTGGAANKEMHDLAQYMRDFAPKDKKLRGAVNAPKLEAMEGFHGQPARGARIPAQKGYQAFHEGFTAGQQGEQLSRPTMAPGAYPKVTPSKMPAASPPASPPASGPTPAPGSPDPKWLLPAAVGTSLAVPIGAHLMRRHRKKKREEEQRQKQQLQAV